jgi:hypothetical protein
MALSDRPFGRRLDPPEQGALGAKSRLGPTLLPLLLAAAIAALLIAMLYPGDRGRVGDTNNAGPSVQTVTPSPTPSTSPPIPTPTPTTEPRPTQAPIR